MSKEIRQLEEEIENMKRNLEDPNNDGAWCLGDPYEALQEMESQLRKLQQSRSGSDYQAVLVQRAAEKVWHDLELFGHAVIEDTTVPFNAMVAQRVREWRRMYNPRLGKLPRDAYRGSVTFEKLRTQNVARCEAVFHPLHHWSASEWACAMAGECGEACNAVKKLRRIADGTNTSKDPQTRKEAVDQIAAELADLIIYADLLAARLDIDLGEAVRAKFNAVSDRMHSSIRL